MADSLNNKSKLVPVKVKVNQPGYPEQVCWYIKGEGVRSDLFLINEVKDSNDEIFVVTPDVVEALGRKEKSHVGVISAIDGAILVPLENSEVIKSHNDIYVVVGTPTTLEVKNAVSAKDSGDFSKVSEIESAKDAILSQMKNLSSSIEIIFSDPFKEARTYKIKKNSSGVYCVEPLSLPASFIGIDDANVYSHSNVLNGSVKTVNYNGTSKKVEEVVDKKVTSEEFVPENKTPDKIEMPSDTKPVIEVSVKPSVKKNVDSNVKLSPEPVEAPTYDKLFSTLDKARSREKKIELTVNTLSNNSSPSDQLDEINSMLKQFASHNPTDKLKEELRKLKAEKDKLKQELNEYVKMNKDLTGKCTDYQNEVYALSANNKDLKAKVVQLKDSCADMKARLSQQDINLKETSAKLAQTLAIISSFVNEGQEFSLDEEKIKAA